MSHFSILVVGDVDYQMAPFHEYECDGVNDEFIQDIDKTEELRADYAKMKADVDSEVNKKKMSFLQFVQYWEGESPVLKSVHEINTNNDKQKWGYILVDENNEVVKIIRRTNPNSFYDYYGEGYKAFLLKKPGENGEQVWTNHALKGEIDFEKMFETKVKKCKETYRRAMKLLNIKEGEVPVLEHTWSSLVDKFHPQDGSKTVLTRDEARAIYDKQPLVKAWKNAASFEEFGFFSKVDDFCMSEEEYIETQSPHALSFGFVADRKYTSNGDMGWWAVVSNEKEPRSWDKEYEEFIKSLPDFVELTMLDCHV